MTIRKGPKTLRSSKSLESGQALIEYVALLFIGTLMVLGLVYQFNDAFRKYLDAWFNSDDSGYLFCLIQNGYLPGETGDCTPPQFNMQSGKAFSTMGASGAVSGGNANGASGNSSPENNPSTGAGPFGREGGSGNRGLISAGPNFGGKGKNAAAGGAKESTGNADGSSSSPVFGGGGAAGAAGRNQGRGRYVPIDTDDTEGGTAVAKTIGVPERDLKDQPRYVAADKTRKKSIESDDGNTKFTFGKILKYLIIIFILFSIFFFIGSQLFAISQGSKKRQ